MTPARGPIVAIIQARMSSTRLPEKVLRPLLGRSVLEWVVRAAQASGVCDHVVIATSAGSDDDAIQHEANRLGVLCVRGSLDDVLDRFIQSVEAVSDHAQQTLDDGAVIRLTADCPMLDPSLIGAVAGLWHATGGDYVSTVAPRSLPRGLDVELVSVETLRRLGQVATGVDRVHVTSHVHQHRADFSIYGLVVSPDASDLRVTLDTPEDAALLDGLAEQLGDGAPRWQDVVAALRENPELRELNAHVLQKAIAEG